MNRLLPLIGTMACGLLGGLAFAADPTPGQQVSQELKSEYAPSVTTRYLLFLPVDYAALSVNS
jgi:hypothetical protein